MEDGTRQSLEPNVVLGSGVQVHVAGMTNGYEMRNGARECPVINKADELPDKLGRETLARMGSSGQRDLRVILMIGNKILSFEMNMPIRAGQLVTITLF